MPRSGSGVYSTPAGTDAVPGFTIESARYNINTHDVETDLNLPRPVVAGGTGANNVNEALVNMKGERSYQEIVNYDSDRFHPGSFFSKVGALGSPITGRRFAGICYMLDDPPNPSSVPPPNTNLTIEARDFDDTVVPARKFVRQKKLGVWSDWATETTAPGGSLVDPSKVLKSGDTMTGALILSGDPSSGLQAATKNYVDTHSGGGPTPPTPPSPASSVPLIESGTGNVGGSLAYARADHVHPALTTTSGGISPSSTIPLIESGSGAVGGASTYARGDHVHPAFTGGTTDVTKVPLSGTSYAVPMTGPLIQSTANTSTVILNVSSSIGSRSIIGTTNQSRRWSVDLGDTAQESGGNTGSDFSIVRWSDTSSALSNALSIKRIDGIVTIPGSLYVNNALINTFANAAYKPGGGPWLDYSDARIKTVVDYYTNGLDTVKALEPVRYTFKGNDVPLNSTASAPAGQPDPNSSHYQSAQAGIQFTGLIAQDVEAIMPEMVKQTGAQIDGVVVSDMRVLDTTSLVYCLVNACKELAARVEALEAARA